jgi:vacuolar-type H+-ATPase subunit E/Vma4
MNKIDFNYTDQIIADFVATEEKNAKREKKDILGLSSLLEQMQLVLAKAKGGKEEVDGSEETCVALSHPAASEKAAPALNANAPSSPTEQTIADTLAQLAAVLSMVQSQIAHSSNSQYKDSLEVQAAQIQEAIANLQQCQKECQEIEQFEQWLNSNPNIQKLLNELWQAGGGGLKKLIAEVIDAAISKQYGIHIDPSSLDPSDYPNLNAYLNAVETVLFGQGVQNFIVDLTGGTDAGVELILKLLKNGSITAAQAQAMLQAILMQMMQMLALIAKADVGGNGTQGPSNTLIAEMMAQMSAIVSQLQGQLAEFSSKKANNDSQIDHDFITQSQASLQKAIDQYNKIEDQEHNQSFWSIFLKIISIIVTVVMCCVGQFEVAAIMAVFLILQQSGALDKLTQAIATALQSSGVLSPEAAKIIADVIVMVIAIVATLGVSAGGTALAGASEVAEAAATVTSRAVNALTETITDATEDGIEMTELSTNTASENATEESVQTAQKSAQSTVQQTAQSATTQVSDQAAEESSNVLKRAFNKVVQRFSQMSKTANAVILVTTQTATSTNLFGDAALAIAAAAHMNEKQKQALEIALQVIGSLLCLVLGGLSMNGMSGGAAVSSIASKLGAAPGLLQKFSMLTNIFGGALQAGSQLKLGFIEMDLANSEAEVGKDEALASLFQNFEKQMDQNMKTSSQHFHTVLKSDGESQANVLSEIFAGESVFAQLLSQAV